MQRRSTSNTAGPNRDELLSLVISDICLGKEIPSKETFGTTEFKLALLKSKEIDSSARAVVLFAMEPLITQIVNNVVSFGEDSAFLDSLENYIKKCRERKNIVPNAFNLPLAPKGEARKKKTQKKKSPKKGA